MMYAYRDVDPTHPHYDKCKECGDYKIHPCLCVGCSGFDAVWSVEPIWTDEDDEHTEKKEKAFENTKELPDDDDESGSSEGEDAVSLSKENLLAGDKKTKARRFVMSKLTGMTGFTAGGTIILALGLTAKLIKVYLKKRKKM